MPQGEYFPGLSEDEIGQCPNPVLHFVREVEGLRNTLIDLHFRGAVLPATPEVQRLLESSMRVCNWFDVVERLVVDTQQRMGGAK